MNYVKKKKKEEEEEEEKDFKDAIQGIFSHICHHC